MLLLSLPVDPLMNISQTIDVAIALDRITAIQWPIAYKLRKRYKYVAVTLAIGCTWGALDITTLFTTTDIAVRCFVLRFQKWLAKHN
jgi:hypothetical protein